jgi:pimeloyl-ACP methyl ester carboxylesterase
MKKEIGIVFIHGAGLNSSIWDDLKKEISSPILLIDFPNRWTDNKSNAKLRFENYVNFVSDKIKNWNEDNFIIVAHSIGALVGLKVAEHFSEKLKGFIAISSVIPTSGNSFVSSLPFPQKIIMPIILNLFGTKPPRKTIVKTLCNDLTTEQTDRIASEFTPESKAMYNTKIVYALPDKHRVYLKLTNDNSMPIEFQDKMASNLNAQEVYTMESGHLPMLSKPKQLAELIINFINEIKET